jgi:hypothetical protein
MQALTERRILEEIESDTDFILFSEERGLLSEHCSIAEARMAYYTQARSFSLGDHLPTIYQRADDEHWVPLS